MRITLNEKSVELDEQNVVLTQLFSKLNIKAATGMAVAVNETIVPKKDWDFHAINENDKILVITAAQGG